MKTFFFAAAVFFMTPVHSFQKDYSCIKISEIFYASSGRDWIELECCSVDRISMDISRLYVTMYYGINCSLSDDPVTIYSYNRPETPWDDRFAVVYLTSSEADETDLTGDTNRNGILEIYCSNNPSSLWNREGIAAVDTNDIPDDGMIDFVYYSDSKDEPGTNVSGYVSDAFSNGEWINNAEDLTASAVIIPAGSVNVSIIRTSLNDTNTSADFKITFSMTPGDENRYSSSYKRPEKLFSVPVKKNIFKCSAKQISFQIKILQSCKIEIRLFAVNGLLIKKSQKKSFEFAGTFQIDLEPVRKSVPGLYILHIEAGKGSSAFQKEKITVVMVK